MGATKTNQYSKEKINLARTANALAHPARLTIIETLKKYSFCRNVEFQSILQLTPGAVHGHMKKLKEVNIIKIDYFPHQYIVSLVPENLEELNDFIKN